MKIILSAGGRFHAYHLAQELLRHNALQQLYTFSYTPEDQQSIPSAFVANNTLCQTADYIFTKLRLARIINRTGYNRIKDNFFDSFVAKKLALQNPADLFIGWANYTEKSMAIARSKGAKIIIESGSCHIKVQHNLIKHEYDRWGLTAPAVAKATKEKMLREYAQADYIMTPSHFVRDSFIQQGLAPQKLLLAPYGTDTSFFSPAAAMKKEFIVLFVGMVCLRKGVVFLLLAWHKLLIPHGNIKLIIAGQIQKDFSDIQNKLPINSNITFTGGLSADAIKMLYKQASVFVLPSVEEGFGMVINEAMASGLPVIASTHSGGPERITHGKTGFLYNPYNVDELARLITWCYNNRQETYQMGLAAHKHIQTCTWQAYGDQVYKIYQKALGHE